METEIYAKFTAVFILISNYLMLHDQYSKRVICALNYKEISAKNQKSDKQVQWNSYNGILSLYFSSKSHSNIIADSEWNTVAECTWNLILNDIERSVQNYSAHIFVKITCVN